jgi:hypothetical protein
VAQGIPNHELVGCDGAPLEPMLSLYGLLLGIRCPVTRAENSEEAVGRCVDAYPAY